MKFKANIDIMPPEALLDPQGKVVTNSLKNLGIKGVSNVRIGKHITLYVEGPNEKAANKIVKETCDKLLVNHVMEQVWFTVEKG